MPSLKKLVLPAALTLMLLAPFVGASAAHPHTHTYVGTAVNSVAINVKVEDAKLKYHLDAAVVGLCLDGSPFLKNLFPPEPIRDGDTDVGVGGACFAYQTVYGDDTGATLNVAVQESISLLRPVYFACVDVSGDGVCNGKTEPYNLCTIGSAGAYSLSDGVNGPCTIFADPAAVLNPAVFVYVIGGLNAEDGTVTPNVASAGNIYLF